MNNDIIAQVNVEDEMRESYLSYAMSVIASRALPDVRDGLKPVQRRILYAMREMGMDPTKQHRKCAGIIGEVLKSYHPHGDSSVYDALVRMAQDFTLRYPLVDGHGNFGSIDPDPPAAYRYTEARLARTALDVLADIDKETVPFVNNFDNQGVEPSVLPGRLPQLLVNGSSGIAVGMATNIPPHNLGEIADAIVAMIDDPEISDDGLCDIVKGPDFPTGGTIMGHEAIREAYKTGRGSITIRGKAEIVEERGKHKIVITEIPYQVYKGRILEAVSEAYSEKRIVGIARMDDESNRKGMRVVIELQRNATPKIVLNQLFKHTPLQATFGFNMLALVPVAPPRRDGSIAIEPQVLTLRQLLQHFIDHRKDVITRRTTYDLRKAEERAHLLEGYRIALDNIDEVIEIVRGSQTTDEAKTRLSERFSLSDVQAQAIVDMRLRTLVGLERQKIENEYAELIKTIAELQDILRSPRRVAQIVKSETLDLRKRFADERRTSVEPAEDEISIEQITPNIDVVVTYTVGGYIKRVSADTFRTQSRGGRGVTGISNLKREDVVRNFFMTKTHDHVLFFTNKGRVYRLRGYEIPDTTRQARGTALVNLLTLPPGEEVTAVFPSRQVRGREVSRDGHQTRRHQEDQAGRVRQRAAQRSDRHQSRRRRRLVGRRSVRRFARHHPRVDARHGGALQREERAPDGARRTRRQGNDAGIGRYHRRDGRHRGRTAGSASRYVVGLRQAHANRRVPAYIAWRKGRQGVRAPARRHRPGRRPDSRCSRRPDPDDHLGQPSDPPQGRRHP